MKLRITDRGAEFVTFARVLAGEGAEIATALSCLGMKKYVKRLKTLIREGDRDESG
ncbi:hypothetical protein [Desulfosporosinus sp. FKB]|uniref:hypothetical protein n=1 Tax=Desulfosporosinus sp. FKB TaxID=1969835 RepID=UPI0014829461|nr:hypothetical protein [Desulfosporosinus sp. FKB]